MNKNSVTRCNWVDESSPEYIRYHDEEWGVPVYNDQVHFEFLVLEGAQAGLSWLTVLKRRDGYRKAFYDFDPHILTQINEEEEIEKLLNNHEIIRNKLKIRSVFNNAGRFLEVQREFGSFSDYIWSFVDNKPQVNYWNDISEVPAKTAVSDAISKDLKKRGFSFVGSTIIYAHMQACGLVNDHITSCFRFSQLK